MMYDYARLRSEALDMARRFGAHAEDFAHDALVVMLTRADPQPRAPERYARRVMRRAITDAYRYERRRRMADLSDAPEPHHTPDEAARIDASRLLERARADDAALLGMTYLDDAPRAAVAAHFGTSANTITQRLPFALERARLLLT